MGMMISLVSIHDGKMGMVIDFGGYEGYKEMRVVSWAGMKVGFFNECLIPSIDLTNDIAIKSTSSAVPKSMSNQSFKEIVGSMALHSRTKLPSHQNVKLTLGSSSPGSVHRHLTFGPIFSITSNLTIPPSTRSSSLTFTSSAKPSYPSPRRYK
ncbi:unnamed protein product, partial [Vitis vinifera]